jgi:hypothetical protein
MDATPQQKLDAEDPRFHAIAVINTGTGSIATTEKFGKKEVNFGLPSAPAIYLDLARGAHLKRRNFDLTTIFVKHPQGIWPENHSPLFDYFGDFMAEVIFSFTALEAFSNEVIPQDFLYSYKKTKNDPPRNLAKPEIERLISLDEKLKKILPSALNVKSFGGSVLWQDYKQLKAIRDRLIHMKSIDRKSSGAEHQTLWGLLLEKQNFVFPDIAANILQHFVSPAPGRRWLTMYKPIKS